MNEVQLDAVDAVERLSKLEQSYAFGGQDKSESFAAFDSVINDMSRMTSAEQQDLMNAIRQTDSFNDMLPQLTVAFLDRKFNALDVNGDKQLTASELSNYARYRASEAEREFSRAALKWNSELCGMTWADGTQLGIFPKTFVGISRPDLTAARNQFRFLRATPVNQRSVDLLLEKRSTYMEYSQAELNDYENSLPPADRPFLRAVSQAYEIWRDCSVLDDHYYVYLNGRMQIMYRNASGITGRDISGAQDVASRRAVYGMDSLSAIESPRKR